MWFSDVVFLCLMVLYVFVVLLWCRVLWCYVTYLLKAGRPATDIIIVKRDLPCCGTCLWFARVHRANEKPYESRCGYCYRYGPIGSRNSGDFDWPIVGLFHTCPEHERVKND